MRCRNGAPLAKLIRCVLPVSAGMGFGGYLGARESMQITYTSIRVVDYHDQLELPVPRLAGLETLVGRQQAESALASLPPGGDDERPHRLLMRVDFRADVDLAELAYKKNSTVLAISLFCGTDNPDLSIGPPTVYLQGQPLLQGKWGQATQSEASSSPGSREYHFFFNVARRENFKSKPPQRGYDLRRNPEDICFYLTGGNPGWLGFKFKSRVATIPKSEIAEAFRKLDTSKPNPGP